MLGFIIGLGVLFVSFMIFGYQFDFLDNFRFLGDPIGNTISEVIINIIVYGLTLITFLLLILFLGTILLNLIAKPIYQYLKKLLGKKEKLKFTDKKSKYKINSFPLNNEKGEFTFFSSLDSLNENKNILYSKNFSEHHYAINGNVNDFSSCSKVENLLKNDIFTIDNTQDGNPPNICTFKVNKEIKFFLDCSIMHSSDFFDKMLKLKKKETISEFTIKDNCLVFFLLPNNTDELCESNFTTKQIKDFSKKNNNFVEDRIKRKKALKTYKYWVDIASELGCKSMRNVCGENITIPFDEKLNYAIEGVSELGNYAAKKNISLLIENHNGYSSSPEWMISLMEAVNLENVGILGDFTNWTLKRNPDTFYPDPYKGIELLAPYIHAVSAKSSEFTSEGEEITINYKRMFEVLKKAPQLEFIGVEFFGNKISRKEGAIRTKELIEKFI